MRIAEVIGTVTLSRWHPALTGYRWIIGVPFSLKALRSDGGRRRRGPGDLRPTWVPAAAAGSASAKGRRRPCRSIPEKKPVDAYCACILDTVSVVTRLANGDLGYPIA